MATRVLDLFADVDQGRLVQSFVSTLQATLPRFVFGDSIPVSFRPLKSNGNNSISPWRELDLTGKTVRIAIGQPAGSPLVGSFTLTYSGNTTASISYDATGDQIATALNALGTITAAGGVAVTRATTGAFRIVFNSVGARVSITADTAALYPSTGANIRTALEGDGITREVVVIRLENLPAAYAELTDEFPVAGITFDVLREGVDGVEAADAIAATVTMNADGRITGDGFEIGGVPFIFSDPADDEGEIAIGVDQDTTATNIIEKINAHSTVLVTAALGAEGAPIESIVLTAKTPGVAGNSIETDTGDVVFSSPTLTGGADAVAEIVAVSKIVSFELSPPPYAGSYILTADDVGSSAIDAQATSSEIATALSGLGGATVSGDFPRFTIEFSPSAGAVGTVAADLSGLIVPKGRSGSLNTNTAAMIELLNGNTQATARLEIELLTVADGTTWTVLQTECTIIEDVISNGPNEVTGGPIYVTMETLLQLFNPDPVLRLGSHPKSEISPIRILNTNPAFVSRLMLPTDDIYTAGISFAPYYDAIFTWHESTPGLGNWRLFDDVSGRTWNGSEVAEGTIPSNLSNEPWVPDVPYDGTLSVSSALLGTGQGVEVIATGVEIPGLWTLYSASPNWIWHPPGTVFNITTQTFQYPSLTGATAPDQSLVYVDL